MHVCSCTHFNHGYYGLIKSIPKPVCYPLSISAQAFYICSPAPSMLIPEYQQPAISSGRLLPFQYPAITRWIFKSNSPFTNTLASKAQQSIILPITPSICSKITSHYNSIAKRLASKSGGTQPSPLFSLSAWSFSIACVFADPKASSHSMPRSSSSISKESSRGKRVS